MTSREYMRHIREFKVAKGTVSMWWLGQNGWILKSPEGVVVVVDPYLTDSCERMYPDAAVDVRRQVPVFIEPGDLDVDVFMATHSHGDHADPETIGGLPERVKAEALFVAPFEVQPILEQAQVNMTNYTLFHPKQEWEHRDVHAEGTFALPTDDTDLNHMGFLFTFRETVRLYVTGDTANHFLFDYMKPRKIDVMCTCINGGFNNLSPWEAARATMAVQPTVVVPCHYDMMAGNSVPPEPFHNALKVAGATSRFTRLAHMDPFIYPA